MAIFTQVEFMRSAGYAGSALVDEVVTQLGETPLEQGALRQRVEDLEAAQRALETLAPSEAPGAAGGRSGPLLHSRGGPILHSRGGGEMPRARGAICSAPDSQYPYGELRTGESAGAIRTAPDGGGMPHNLTRNLRGGEAAGAAGGREEEGRDAGGMMDPDGDEQQVSAPPVTVRVVANGQIHVALLLTPVDETWESLERRARREIGGDSTPIFTHASWNSAYQPSAHDQLHMLPGFTPGAEFLLNAQLY
ncbi:hypothetical protein T484DRAFT_2019198 [Baffinella frigidus]|nr:hypothetical protein T484DRAFT_2019198 [Cryptophyta sp. CCMP2293]